MTHPIPSTSSTPVIIQDDVSITNSKNSTPPKEFCILFIGTLHKQPLFEKMLLSAERFERHMQYQDTVYLYYSIQGEPFIVELNDPGIEHTGAREMAIRKADAVILCYAAYDADSFHQLASIADDFKLRKNGIYPPILLVCNEDELLNSNQSPSSSNDLAEIASAISTSISIATPDTEEQAQSSTSEGYQSAEEISIPSPIPSSKNSSNNNTYSVPLKLNRPSMENIRKSREQFCPITEEQGKNMAKLFGPDCDFISVSFSEFCGSAELINRLINRILSQKSNHGKNSVEKRKRDRRQKSPILGIRRRCSESSLKFFSSKLYNKSDKKMNKKGERDSSLSSSGESSENSSVKKSTKKKEIGKRSKSIMVLHNCNNTINDGLSEDHINPSLASPPSSTYSSTTIPQINHIVATSPLPSPRTPDNNLDNTDAAIEYPDDKETTDLKIEKTKVWNRQSWNFNKITHKSSNVCAIS